MRFLLSAVVAVLLVSFLAVPSNADPARAPVRMEVTKITPAVVDGSAPGTLTISGTLTNTGDQPVNGLQASVSRGKPAQTEGAAERALNGGGASEQTPAVPVPGALAPGGKLPFTVQVPLTGPGSLNATQPGTYPAEFSLSSGGSRIAGGDFLLPVLAPPGAPAPPPPHPPMPASLLLPIVDYPRMEQKDRPGAPTVLADDDIASSLQPGGRLSNLAKGVRDGMRQVSPQTAQGVCFAIDPDLVDTVAAMQGGYQVRQPDGSVRPGTGADAARHWLGDLRSAVRGHCVVQLPDTDADVSALARAGLPDLVRGSMDNYGSNVLRRSLGVEPRNDVIWPAGGALNHPAAEALASSGVRTAVLSPEAMTTPKNSLQPANLQRSGMQAQPVDQLVSAALNPEHHAKPNQTAPAPDGGDSLTAEKAVGALAFRSTAGYQPNANPVIAPPRRWSVGSGDVATLLTGMEQLAKAGYVKPAELAEPKPQHARQSAQQGTSPQSSNPAAPQQGQRGQPGQPGQPGQQGQQGQGERTPQPIPADLAYPGWAARDEIPAAVARRIAQQNFKVGDLFRSSLKDPQVNLDPADVTSPLRDGLLHGASNAWRGNPAAANAWVDRGTASLQHTLDGVQVARIAPISLANSNSPIPVTVNNQLPITVSVRLRAPAPAGVAIDIRSMDRLRIPARGNRLVFVPANVQRPGPFTLDISATAMGGTQLGAPSELQAESNVYGGITRIVTIGAGALLFLLSGRRLVRRILRARREKKQGAGAPPPAGPDATTGPVVDPTADTAEIVTTERDRHPG